MREVVQVVYGARPLLCFEGRCCVLVCFALLRVNHRPFVRQRHAPVIDCWTKTSPLVARSFPDLLLDLFMDACCVGSVRLWCRCWVMHVQKWCVYRRRPLPHRRTASMCFFAKALPSGFDTNEKTYGPTGVAAGTACSLMMR